MLPQNNFIIDEGFVFSVFFSKIGKVCNVSDSVWEGHKCGFVVDTVVVGAREPVWAQHVSRQGRWNSRGAMRPNLSPLNQTLLVQAKREEVPGNVKHEAADEDTLKHRHHSGAVDQSECICK